MYGNLNQQYLFQLYFSKFFQATSTVARDVICVCFLFFPIANCLLDKFSQLNNAMKWNALKRTKVSLFHNKWQRRQGRKKTNKNGGAHT